MKTLASLCSLILLFAAAHPTAGAVLESLTDDFSAAAVDGAKWSVLQLGLEAGTGIYTADTTTNLGQLTISGVGDADYWSGGTLQSVDAFASDRYTVISVDRISLSGTGSAQRSALWISQDSGPFVLLSQNTEFIGAWSYNNNVGGPGINAGLDFVGVDAGEHQMQLVYRPLGGTNAEIDIYLDGVKGNTIALTNWDNTKEFNVRLSAMARAEGDTATAVFDNFGAKALAPLAAPAQNGSTLSAATFPVANDDLLNGLLPTITNGALVGNEGTSDNAAMLTNGVFGAANKDGAPGEIVAIQDGTVLTYQLDLAASPFGYDITGINTYAGWNDSGRDDQNYHVSVSFVDDPDFFVPLADVQYDNGTGSPGSEGSNTAVFLTPDVGDYLATNVAAIRFAFGVQEQGYAGYREIDVFGDASPVVPEPSTWVLGLSAGALLASYGVRRRRTRQTTA